MKQNHHAAIDKWAAAITRLNTLENDFDKTYWFQLGRRNELRAAIARATVDCREAKLAVRTIEAQEKAE